MRESNRVARPQGRGEGSGNVQAEALAIMG